MESRSDLYVVCTLGRVRAIINEAIRSYESNGQINHETILMARRNLQRISTVVSETTYDQLKGAIEALLSLQSSRNVASAYVAPRNHLNGPGRPTVQVDYDQLKMMYDNGFTVVQMANHLGCSKRTIYNRLYAMRMPIRGRYSEISYNLLKSEIRKIRDEHPNAGQTMVEAYLRAADIYVQRSKIRQALSEVDPIGAASRWSQSIKRRVYSVVTPNSLWHMDAHLKLSRWGFVVHGCIDGYSRLIIYLRCETSIQAEPVVTLFAEGVNRYGLPSRVRSDHGYENILVALLMNAIRGLHRGSHITGKSVHNQRIERLWVDVYKEVCDSVYSELYTLENDRILDLQNNVHLFCVQFVYKCVINRKLLSFQSAWNIHKLRTENNRSPRQLWLEGILKSYNTSSTAIEDILERNGNVSQRLLLSLRSLGINMSDDVVNRAVLDINQSNFTASLQLNEAQTIHLQNISNLDKSDREKYVLCVNSLTSQ